MGPKIDPKSFQNRFWIRPRFQDRSGTDFGPILAPTWGHLGGQNRAMLVPGWSANRFFDVQEGIEKPS